MQEDKNQVDVDTSDAVENEHHNEPDGDSSSSEDTYQEAEKFKELSDNYRKRAEKAEAELKKARSQKPQSSNSNLGRDEILSEAERAIEAKLAQRDLDEMDHSDTIKEQIQKIAQLNGTSVRKAEQDPYIQHMIAEEARQNKMNEAASNGANKGELMSSYDGSKALSAESFNLDTEEGRKSYQEAKAVRAKYLRENPN